MARRPFNPAPFGFTIFFGCTLVTIVQPGCSGQTPPSAPSPQNRKPAAISVANSEVVRKWNPKVADALADAAGLWRLGSDYLPRTDEKAEVQLAEDLGDQGQTTFSGIDDRARRFLEHPEVKPVVQFSCARFPTRYENALEAAIQSNSPEIRLQALGILLRVRAPSSVSLQSQALTSLHSVDNRPEWVATVKEMDACFAPASLIAELQRNPSVDRYEGNNLFFWTIRASGVVQLHEALPRLTELSTSDNLYTSLAAERSLEDFTGPDADAALKACLLGWRYNAYLRAGHALAKRNKPLLNATLMAVQAPEACRYQQGLLLAECDNPAAVPILCETVPKYATIDKKMFEAIGRLALPEHRIMIEALPKQVRKNQQVMAEAAARQFFERTGGSPKADKHSTP